jgi:hypothetical protein
VLDGLAAEGVMLILVRLSSGSLVFASPGAGVLGVDFAGLAAPDDSPSGFGWLAAEDSSLASRRCRIYMPRRVSQHFKDSGYRSGNDWRVSGLHP